eukprot:GHVU01037538.1.p1 GENE.GHVU01037538.1~~GHVU01037538.1.p1  ORF type:complete len:125 (+),score=1.08 GHVU01037538.1:536-910(+)
MVEVISPLINPDLIDPPMLPKPARSYGALSLMAVGPMALPPPPCVLGHPSETKVLTDSLNGVQGIGKTGKWVSSSALPRSSTLGPNSSHVPIRSKFVAPPLLSKAASQGRQELGLPGSAGMFNG